MRLQVMSLFIEEWYFSPQYAKTSSEGYENWENENAKQT